MGWIAGTEPPTETLPMTLVLAHVLAVVSGLLGALFLRGVLNPSWLMMVARRFIDGTGAGGAAAVRLMFAALLWFSAPVASTPAAFRALALVMAIAAAGTLVLGRDGVTRFADRMDDWPPSLARLPIAIGMGLCAFVLWSISSVIGKF